MIQWWVLLAKCAGAAQPQWRACCLCLPGSQRDAFAVEGWTPEDHPRSVLSGRTNDEVRADPERMWHSDRPAAQASVQIRPPVVPGPEDDELAALDALGTDGVWEVFGRRLRLTHLDKVLFPARPGEPCPRSRHA